MAEQYKDLCEKTPEGYFLTVSCRRFKQIFKIKDIMKKVKATMILPKNMGMPVISELFYF